MSELNLKANIAGADDFYAELLAIHDGKSKEQSDAINARLILSLANHVGDRAILTDAMQKAVTAAKG